MVTAKIRNETGVTWDAGVENCNRFRGPNTCEYVNGDTKIYYEGWCPNNPGDCGTPECDLGTIGPFCGAACDPTCQATSCYKKTYTLVCA